MLTQFSKNLQTVVSRAGSPSRVAGGGAGGGAGWGWGEGRGLAAAWITIVIVMRPGNLNFHLAPQPQGARPVARKEKLPNNLGLSAITVRGGGMLCHATVG